jgi:hypothetical protein
MVKNVVPEVLRHGVDTASHVHGNKAPAQEHDVIDCLQNTTICHVLEMYMCQNVFVADENVQKSMVGNPGNSCQQIRQFISIKINASWSCFQPCPNPRVTYISTSTAYVFFI